VLYIIQHAIALEIWIEADIDAFVRQGPDGVDILSYPLPTPKIMQTVQFSLETDDVQVVIRIARFRLDVVTEKGKRPPLSFVFAALLEGKMLFRKHYVMPELDNGKKIWYQLDEVVEADAVKVFYVDRCTTCVRTVSEYLLNKLYEHWFVSSE
jgi:hypothetical protein